MANVRTVLTRGRHDFTPLPSAARTATPDSQEYELVGVDYRALHLIVDVTAVNLTPSITVTIAGVDPASGQTYTILAATAIATVSTTVLRIGPGLTAVANSTANDYLPPVFRVTVAHADADSITYSVAGLLCP